MINKKIVFLTNKIIVTLSNRYNRKSKRATLFYRFNEVDGGYISWMQSKTS